MNNSKTLSKLTLVRTLISPSDILTKKSQKYILGGRHVAIACRCGHCDDWKSDIFGSNFSGIYGALEAADYVCEEKFGYKTGATCAGEGYEYVLDDC